MNVKKRVFFTWDERLVLFNSFQEGTRYFWDKFGITLGDIPEGWFGLDSDGKEHFLFSTIIHYNDGKMSYD